MLAIQLCIYSEKSVYTLSWKIHYCSLFQLVGCIYLEEPNGTVQSNHVMAVKKIGYQRIYFT